jgi:hypothetical protein
MYIDPYMQKAILLDNDDPNALLEGTGAPVGNAPAPISVGTPEVVNAPQGSPAAPQGSPAAPPGYSQFQPDPMLQGLAGIRSAFSNLGTYAGAPQANNIFQNQIDQQALSHKLANERYASMRSGSQDPIVRGVQQYAAAAGLTNLPWDEQVEAYRKTKQSMYADPAQSVYGQKMDDITKLLNGDDAGATKLANGLLEVRPDPYGGQGVFDLSTGEFTTAYTPEQIASGKAMIAGSTANAQGAAQTDWKVVGEVETNLSTLADEFEASRAGVQRGRQALEMLNSGQVEPGLVSGAVLDYLGIGSSKLAYYQNLSQQTLFEELNGAKLTPVSDADIRALAKLFTSASQSPEVARGNLEAFLLRKEREQERKGGRMRREASRIKDEGYRADIMKTYKPFMDFKAIDSWDEVKEPGGA